MNESSHDATQISLRPADFKKWVRELDLQGLYKAYLDQALQARVWRLLGEADASEDMWSRPSPSSGRLDYPMAAFRALEIRANL